MLGNQTQMTTDEQHRTETFSPLEPDQHVDPLQTEQINTIIFIIYILTTILI